MTEPAAATPPTAPTSPAQGWPGVPSPKGPPDGIARADLAARRRVLLSPRTAAVVRARGQRQANKPQPIGPLPNQSAPRPLRPADQSLAQPRPGPSPNGKGKWKQKRAASTSAARKLSLASAKREHRPVFSLASKSFEIEEHVQTKLKQYG